MQIGRDREALRLVLITVLLAFAAVWSAELLLRRRARPA